MKHGIRLLCVASMLACGQAWGETQWTLTTATSSTVDGISVTARGWASTGGAGNNTGTLVRWSLDSYPGIGMTTTGECDGCSPNHAIDNSGANEMLLLVFNGGKVNLSGFTISWPGTTSSYDTDVTVAAYTGSGVPPDLATANSSTQTWSTLNAGWSWVGHYSDVAANSIISTQNPSNANGLIYSSYWLIGAYNPRILSGTGTCYLGTATPVDGCTPDNDYIKLVSVLGVKGPDTTTQVPEPGSLALLGVSLIGLLLATKRRKA